MVHRNEFSEKKLTNQTEEKEKSDCPYDKTLYQEKQSVQ